ncbi:MBL fold metallo-hydrolase [Streptomyces ficellus]|uniref:MBL fold metallo-hydrolase n=1 Tax=Streptomyces ficellus TaxID=1977088 RepID=A0ABT7Z1M1_9ACTN|nr:MBL fold metallo-hydrolase [Streptomyces ficellus]MDN3293392.1 MBL fold metallo-hydrolase [Streptomyces ficellus]
MRIFRRSSNAGSSSRPATDNSPAAIARRPLLGAAAALPFGLLGCNAAAKTGTEAASATASETAPRAGQQDAAGGPAPTVRVRLLGTGGPEMSTTRQGMSTLIEAGGLRLLFDVGRGATQNMYESRVNPKDVTKIFLTHLHNDHYEDLPTLWLNPWFMLGRTEQLEIWGPPGTAGMVKGMRAMYQHDLDHRSNALFKKEYLDIRVHEIRPGIVYDQDGVKVTAFTVEHKDGNPAYGFRFDHSGKSVLLSGDTTYHENVVTHGKGVDALIHNVIAFDEELTKSGKLKAVEEKLTTPEQAARVFSEARPRIAVFSHIAKKGLHGEAGDQVIMNRTRKAGYDGPLYMGLDRMTIDIADDVTVRKPLSTAGLPELDGPGVRL